MKKYFLFALAITPFLIFAQPNTDVFLFDLNTNNGAFKLSNMKNISDNEGYDNQPSFLDNNTILFAGSRNGQTDIVKYNINYDSKIFINHTEGGEYSPLKIPNQDAVSAIRLDPDGKQFLYKYSLRNGQSEVLVDDVIIGYHVWYNDNIIVSSVLEDGGLYLYTNDIKESKSHLQQKNIGRSLHNIPNSNLVSYISKEDVNVWKIKSLNPISGATKSIAATIDKAEDICWLPNGTIVMGKENRIYTYTPNKSVDWSEVISLEKLNIKNITRLVVSPDGKKIAIVGEAVSSAKVDNNPDNSSSLLTEDQVGSIVQKHIEPFNNGDISFVNAFDENVTVSNFPNKLLYTGRLKMKENYTAFFKNNTNSSVTVNNRIVLNDMVIDSEIGTVNNTINRHVTIYKTGNGTIKSMTFLSNSKTESNPEIIVDKQLEAYNKRDIEAFMDTYADSIKLYNFPEIVLDDTKEKMKAGYKTFFENTPDLKAKILKRIVIGNKVIDKEQVTINGNTIEAVAIYEVHNDKISKITFIR